MSPIKLFVPASSRGVRIDQFIADADVSLTRSRVQSLIDDGVVFLNNMVVRKPGFRLHGGEDISFEIPAPVSATPQPEALPISVLYEDKEIIVLNKAAGMVVHPAAGHARGTLVNALIHHVEDLQGIGGELRPGIVHRLDKETSGCLVVAKSERALNALQDAFKQRTVEKIYLAIVSPAPAIEAGTISTLYGRHPTQRQRFSGRVKVGKPAVTHYSTRESFGAAALLEVMLETGRTHQIRVHLSEAGWPLIGDATYGSSSSRKKSSESVRAAANLLGRQALHAWKLSFAHPTKPSRMIRVEAPPPDDFLAALKVLRAPLK